MALNKSDKITKAIEKLYINYFSIKIRSIEQKVNHMDNIFDRAISALEDKKRILRRQNDPNVIYSKESEGINKHNRANHQTLINLEIKERLSVDELDRAIATMDREISLIQDQHDDAVLELEKKKETLKKRLSSVGKLDLLINVLTYKIFETQHEHRKEIEELLNRRNLISKGDLSENQTALTLAELDRTISDLKNTHEATMLSLEGQRSELRKETALKTEHMDIIMDSIKIQHDTMLAEFEERKINGTPSEIEETDRRIAELNRMFLNDVENLRKLQAEGWKDYDSQERVSAILENRGVRITPSGHFLTTSGQHLTRSEASCLGYLDGVDMSTWENLLNQHTFDKAGDSESAVSQSSSTVSTESAMASDDIHYLKTVLGKPLTLALAEITAKQPRDPIHYLGHWLFKYRYNQEIDDVKKQEIQKLITERDRLEREKLHAMIQDEARVAVLNMVIRAEEEAIRNELERIAREAAMLEAEDEGLESEARDVLGVYSGPTAGNRIN